MNADYKEISSVDAAKIFKVTPQTVSCWCRSGILRFQDAAGPNSNKPRYVIPEYEVNRVRELIKKYGSRKWLLYNDISKQEEIKESEVMKSEILVENEPTIPSKLTPEKVVNTIMYIQEIREHLEDLEAERNQLLNELEELRNEVLTYIE